MNDSNRIRDAFAHYRYRRASQLLEGDSDAHWTIAYQHADKLIDFDSFEAGWALKEATITAQREALARAERELRIERMALTEAIDLISQVLASGELERTSPTLHAKLESCVTYNAQAEQQEAREPSAAEVIGSLTHPLCVISLRGDDRQKALANDLAKIINRYQNGDQEAQGAQAGDERAAFESAWSKRLDLSRDKLSGCYYSQATEWRWEGWQARAALGAQPAVRGAEHDQ